MSLSVLVRDVLISNKMARDHEAEEMAAVVQQEIIKLLEDPAVRNEIYDMASEDPMIGDDIDGMIIGLILECLTKVLGPQEVSTRG